VIDVSYNEQEIIEAITTVLKQQKPDSSPVYGGGNAGEKIADLLKELPLQFHKTITY